MFNFIVLLTQVHLQHLTSLDLSDCGVSKLDDYRESVYKLLPNLQTLDGCEQVNAHNGKLVPSLNWADFNERMTCIT